MEYFLEQSLNGLALGCVYALIALGFSMVYGVLKFLNFAHSEVFTVGVFAVYFVFSWGAETNLPPWVIVLTGLMAGCVISGIVAILIERIAYRPIRSAPTVSVFLSAIGMSVILQIIGVKIFGAATRGIPEFELGLSPRVFAILVLVISFLILRYLVQNTTLGLQLRAVSEKADTARLMGINPEKSIMFAFLLGGLFAGVAALIWATSYGTVHPQMGFHPGLKCFIIAVLGSIGRLEGTFIVGVALGLIETYIGAYLPSDISMLRDPLVFLILFVALVVKPNGIFGSTVSEKV